jgi:hypothetical protein
LALRPRVRRATTRRRVRALAVARPPVASRALVARTMKSRSGNIHRTSAKGVGRAPCKRRAVLLVVGLRRSNIFETLNSNILSIYYFYLFAIFQRRASAQARSQIAKRRRASLIKTGPYRSDLFPILLRPRNRIRPGPSPQPTSRPTWQQKAPMHRFPSHAGPAVSASAPPARRPTTWAAPAKISPHDTVCAAPTDVGAPAPRLHMHPTSFPSAHGHVIFNLT